MWEAGNELGYGEGGKGRGHILLGWAYFFLCYYAFFFFFFYLLLQYTNAFSLYASGTRALVEVYIHIPYHMHSYER